MNRRVVISGCSGGGKSTLIGAMRERGYRVVEEPGRRIVHEELASNGSALPWVDLAAFAKRAMAMAIADWEASAAFNDWSFFDRGLVDAASAFENVTGEPVLTSVGRSYPYHCQVFMAPPWPEIYAQDSERQHGFKDAEQEYARLATAYPALGYEVTILPKVSVQERTDFVLQTLELRSTDQTGR